MRQFLSIEVFFSRKRMLWKRSMDIIGALAGMIILAPIMLVITLIIKISSPGPVIFRQTRIGYGGKEFNFFKFRTMKQGIDTSTHKEYFADLIQSGIDGECGGQPMYKMEKDPRIIPCGNFLRKYYMDEIPQLINVLLGEMSLVGPRPPIPYEVEKYLFWHYERFDSVPGMTGLWQISGKNKLTFKEMVRLDIQYSRELSFWMDLKILIITPIMIICEAFANQQAPAHDIGLEVGKND